MGLITPRTRHVVNNSYSYDEDLVIITMSNERKSAAEIAAKLTKGEQRRSINSVRYRRRWLQEEDRADWTEKDLAAYHGVEMKKKKKKAKKKRKRG